MPNPSPHDGEEQASYISRCMGDATMVKDYDQKQRAAVCFRTWEDRHKQQAKSAIDGFRETVRAAVGWFKLRDGTRQ